ncbi:hypothetical protein [Nocardia tengchongensis]
MTTATDGDGVPWTLGYVFNHNTAIADKVIPQVTACWWKTDAPKAGKNVYYGNAVDQSGQPSVCWYGGTSQSGSEITVTPTFG